MENNRFKKKRKTERINKIKKSITTRIYPERIVFDILGALYTNHIFFSVFEHGESIKYAYDLLNGVELYGQRLRLQHKETGLGKAFL